MLHLDEGTIHAWLDGACSEQEAAAVADHIARCRSCADAVAEARGVIAASSRILTALDIVPGEVIPAARETVGTQVRRLAVARRPVFRAAAAMAVAAMGIFWIVRETQPPLSPTVMVQQDSVIEPETKTSVGNAPLTSASVPMRPGEMMPLDAENQARGSSPDSHREAREISKVLPPSQKRVEPLSVAGTTADAGRVQQERGQAPETLSKSAQTRAAQPISAMAAGAQVNTATASSPETPVLTQSHECSGVVVRVYAIGSPRSVTLIDAPDSIPVRQRRPMLQRQVSPRPMRAADLARTKQPEFLIPGVEHCSSEVKLFVQSNSAANVLRWAEVERKRIYVLHGVTSKDTLTLVRRALAKRLIPSDTVKKGRD